MANDGTAAAGAGTGEGAGTGTGAGAGAGAGAAAPWYGSIDDGDLKGWIEAKKYASPLVALQAHRNLEQAFGADKAGRTVVLPGEKATPQELEAFYTKLGRPQQADGYELKLPDGHSKELVDWLKPTAHGLGLSAKQVQGLVDNWEKMAGGLKEKQQQAAAAAIEEQAAGLRKEWGQGYDAKVATAKQTAQALGIKAEVIDALESALGFGGVMRFFADLGDKVGEGKFVAAAGRAGSFGGLTPAQAQEAIAEKRRDPAFVKALTSGEKEAKAEWDRLHVAAFAKHD